MNYALETHEKDTIYSAKAVSTTENKYSISPEQILMTQILGVLFPSLGSHFFTRAEFDILRPTLEITLHTL